MATPKDFMDEAIFGGKKISPCSRISRKRNEKKVLKMNIDFSGKR